MIIPFALFSWEVKGDTVAVIDKYKANSPSRTVTNDAEAVIDDLRQRGVITQDRRRVVYRDSAGQWDEMLLDGRLRFSGVFRLLPPEERQALADQFVPAAAA